MEFSAEKGDSFLAKEEPAEEPPEVRIIDGRNFKRVDSGYTVREYFSHSTPEKGPGPGWDSRTKFLDDEFAMRVAGRTFSAEEVYGGELSHALPDKPFYQWKDSEA